MHPAGDMSDDARTPAKKYELKCFPKIPSISRAFTGVVATGLLGLIGWPKSHRRSQACFAWVR